MKPPKTLQQAIQFFTDYENCRQFMLAIRWDDGQVRCPQCDSVKVSYIESERVYRCHGNHPKKKFSLKVGTVMEDSPIGLDKWLPVMWMMVNCKNGISSYEVARSLRSQSARADRSFACAGCSRLPQLKFHQSRASDIPAKCTPA